MQNWVEIIRKGGVVACATESQFGLFADATDEVAVDKVLTLKGREQEHTIACVAPSLAIAERYVVLNARARELASSHWPGPLTLVARARVELPAGIIKDGKVGVRVVGPSPAADLCWAYGGLLTATSANRTGSPAALSAEEVLEQFGDELDGVLAEPAPGGLPSTILMVTGDAIHVIRQGAIEVLSGSGHVGR